MIEESGLVKAVFIVGCGYVGRRVATLETARGAEVSALVRSDESASRLHNAGIQTFKGDLDNPKSPGNLPLAGKLLYYFAPPPSEGKTDPRIVSFLSTMTASNLPDRIVLISTTAVYGDCHGEWITEERPTRPQTDRAFRRLSAEGMLTEWGKQRGVDIVILRVAGIYGPGRLPARYLQEGRPVLRMEEAPFSNRIHADDLSHICIAAADKGISGAIYNVSDGHPTSMTNYFCQVAHLLRLPRPTEISFEEAKRTLSAGMLSYLMESRRLSNRKLCKELDIELVYPDISTGLPACLSS